MNRPNERKKPCRKTPRQRLHTLLALLLLLAGLLLRFLYPEPRSALAGLFGTDALDRAVAAFCDDASLPSVITVFRETETP